MDKKDEIIVVESGSFFPIAVVGLGFIAFAWAAAIFFVKLHYVITVDIFKPWSKILVEFVTDDLPWMVLLSLVGTVLMCSKRITCFNPAAKAYMKGFKLFTFQKGAWIPLSLENCSYITFQRYKQNIDYTFGGLLNKHVDEYVYDLRFVKKNGTFESFVSASTFQAVAEIVKLGNVLSKLYGIPFSDYVKQALMKAKVLDFTDGEDWPSL
ncbi:MAG: hypothetical protein MJZ14_04720 [Paludibacteraceae bacterium]|nr:hypothetical protein [Paludibacteraceae bacterium]